MNVLRTAFVATGLILFLAAMAQPITRAEVEGLTVISAKTANERLMAEVNKAGDIVKGIQAFEAHLHGLGYPLMRVTDYDLSEDGVLRAKIAEGRINFVEVVGNRRTRSDTLYYLAGLTPGEVYYAPKVEAARRRLGRLGYLNDVKIGPVTDDESKLGSVTARIEVEEGRSQQVGLALGYTQEAGLVGFVSAQDLNFAGLGHRARLAWQRDSFRDITTGQVFEGRSSYFASYQADRVVGSPFGIGVQGYDRTGQFYPTFSTIETNLRRFEHRSGAGFWLGYEFNESMGVRALFRSDQVDFDDAPNHLIGPTGKAANRGKVQTIGGELIWDTREKLNFPRTGFYFSFTAENAVAPSDFRFNRFVADFRYFMPVKDNSSLAFRAMAGVAGANAPLSEQFWIGGYDSLRGYAQDEFFGQRMAVVSGEFRFPVWEDIQASFFIDQGLAWNPGSRPTFSNLKTGVGVGLHFASPIGPIKLEFAVGRKGHTYLSLGASY